VNGQSFAILEDIEVSVGTPWLAVRIHPSKDVGSASKSPIKASKTPLLGQYHFEVVTNEFAPEGYLQTEILLSFPKINRRIVIPVTAYIKK
jgi:hypothetical protein